MVQVVERILHPTDLKTNWDYFLRFTLHAAKKNRSKIILLHVLGRSRPTVQLVVDLCLTGDQRNRIRNWHADHAIRQIQKLIMRIHSGEGGFDAQIEDLLESIVIEEGWPAEVIIAKARELDCDAVYMGARAGPMAGCFPLNRTVRDVLRHGGKPVLVIPCPKKWQIQHD